MSPSASQRKLFMHAAHRAPGGCASAAEPTEPDIAFAGDDLPEAALPDDTLSADGPRSTAGRRLLLGVLRPQGPTHSAGAWPALRTLATRLAESGDGQPCCCTVELPTDRPQLSWQQCDVLLWSGALSELAGPLFAVLEEYCRAGGGLVALCGADGSLPCQEDATQPHSNAAQPGATDLCQLLGAAFDGPRLPGPIRVSPPATGMVHPLLAGVEPFCSTAALPTHNRTAAELQVLLTGGCGNLIHPAAWLYQRGAGRVFCASLAAPDDLAQPGLLRLLRGAVRWAGRQ